MTDQVHSAPGTLLVQQSSDGVSGGTLLRRAREAAGLHPAGLAATLKVPVQKIEALEADRFDLLPDLVFVRALASSISRSLGMDPQPVLDRLPRTAPPRLVQARDGVNAPFRAPDDPVGPGWRAYLFRPVALAVTGLLLAAAALILLPQSLLDDAVALARSTQTPAPPVLATTSSVASTPGGPVVLAQEVSGNVEAVAAADPASPNLAVYTTPPVAVPEQVGNAAPGTVEPVSLAAALPERPTAAAAAAPDGEGIVVFRTREASWIEVTEAGGKVALRRVLAAGETAAVSGALPLAVKVGKASATEVRVRGEAFDMSAVTRNNVARFQVK